MKTKRAQLTTRQEDFAMAYIETGNASEAYRRAYPRSVNWKPETVHSRASHLLRNSKVLTRVDELKAEHRAHHSFTVNGLAEELWEIRGEARDSGQYGVARQAVMDIAKMMGLVIDKAESEIKLAGELTTEKAILILRSVGIHPEVLHDED